MWCRCHTEPGWLNELGRCRARVAKWARKMDYLTTHTSLSPIRCGFAPGFVNYKKGALDSQVIKLTSCLPMVGGSPGRCHTQEKYFATNGDLDYLRWHPCTKKDHVEYVWIIVVALSIMQFCLIFYNTSTMRASWTLHFILKYADSGCIFLLFSFDNIFFLK